MINGSWPVRKRAGAASPVKPVRRAAVAHLSSTPTNIVHNGTRAKAILLARQQENGKDVLDGFGASERSAASVRGEACTPPAPPRQRRTKPPGLRRATKSKEGFDWAALAAEFPCGFHREAVIKREDLFMSFDSEGGGTIELDEACRGIEGMLVGCPLPSDFDLRGMVESAIDAAQTHTGGLLDDKANSVDREEFEFMMWYMRWYFELYAFFQQADDSGKDDDRLSKREFTKVVPQLMQWGADVSDPESSWAAIDRDGGGSADFCEFLAWGINEKLCKLKEKRSAPGVGGNIRCPGRHHAQSVDWSLLGHLLPATRSKEDRARRRALFKQLGTDGQGLLSLAEVEEGLSRILCEKEGAPLASIDILPPIRKAFLAAQSIHQMRDGEGSPNRERKFNLVEPSEFRLLLAYLRYYFEIFTMFQDIDDSADNDECISKHEFIQMYPQLLAWGVVDKAGAEAAFSELDVDQSGQVDFDEFLDWAVQFPLDRVEDDHAENDFTVMEIGPGVKRHSLQVTGRPSQKAAFSHSRSRAKSVMVR
ncbi:hypothetical protein AB1Y20_014726 [Prymnesium parvum]|uniref:EF-hand domain-containing protein n=1 Tax=Prymnesium parvum TaxID=97485 RepID=A0AB34IE65_PRYPA